MTEPTIVSIQNAYDWHICIASDQAAANLLPAMDSALKPKKVLLLVTKKMQINEAAAHLEQVLRNNGISKIEFMPINDERDTQTMSSQIESWLIEHAGEKILLNLTGGTKLMTLALYECVRSNLHDRMDVIYLDVDTQQAIFLHPKNHASKTLQTKLDLSNYLLAYGYTLASHQPMLTDADKDAFCQWMLASSDRLAVELGEFNRDCNNLDYASKQNKPLIGFFDANNDIVRQCVLNQWLVKTDTNAYQAVSKQALEFMQGGWLEYAVAHSVKQMIASNKIQDGLFNVQVMTDSKTKNELDCAFLSGNRLHLIECKTRNFSGKESTVAQEALYKLDSLVKLGGLRTKGILVSYRKVPDAVLARAKDLGIQVVQRHQLASLNNHLSSWISRP